MGAHVRVPACVRVYVCVCMPVFTVCLEQYFRANTTVQSDNDQTHDLQLQIKGAETECAGYLEVCACICVCVRMWVCAWRGAAECAGYLEMCACVCGFVRMWVCVWGGLPVHALAT